MDGVTLHSRARRKPADVFELALTYEGIEIRRPGEHPRYMSWDRVSEWEIEERRGGVLLTLRGGGSVTPLVIPRWTVDDLDVILRKVTSEPPAPIASGEPVDLTSDLSMALAAKRALGDAPAVVEPNSPSFEDVVSEQLAPHPPSKPDTAPLVWPEDAPLDSISSLSWPVEGSEAGTQASDFELPDDLPSGFADSLVSDETFLLPEPEEMLETSASAAALEAQQRADEETARREAARLEAQRLEAEHLAEEEAARQAAERVEAKRLEAKRLEAARVETARLEAARLEAERLEAERLVAQRLAEEEAARQEAERREAPKRRAEEAARQEAARLEAERLAAQRLAEEAAAELAAEQAAARLETERLAARQRAEEAARDEAARLEVKRHEAERAAVRRRAEEEAARQGAARLEAARLAAEQASEVETERRREAARLAAEQASEVEAERRREAARLTAARAYEHSRDKVETGGPAPKARPSAHKPEKPRRPRVRVVATEELAVDEIPERPARRSQRPPREEVVRRTRPPKATRQGSPVRVQALVTVVLLGALATAVALILAQSAGLINLPFLGGIT
jgi:hypothetical protein